MIVSEQNAALESPGKPRADRRMGRRAIVEAERFGLVGLFGAVVILFTVLPKTAAVFPTTANFQNIAGNQSVLALISLAAIVPLICGQFDISVGAILGFSSVLTAYAASSWHVGVIVAILLGVAGGGVVGTINGFLVARLGLNSLITTLAVATVLEGITSGISSTPVVNGVPQAFSTFGTSNTLGIPRPFFVLVVAAAGLYYFLEQTPSGRELHAIGSNATASRLVGVPVERLVFRSFVVSGLVCGAAGVLELARAGVGDPNVGTTFTLPGIAAAFLGATVIRPGRFNVLGTAIAIFFLATVVSGLTFLGAQEWLQSVVNGGALVAGIAVSTLIARQRRGEPVS